MLVLSGFSSRKIIFNSLDSNLALHTKLVFILVKLSIMFNNSYQINQKKISKFQVFWSNISCNTNPIRFLIKELIGSFSKKNHGQFYHQKYWDLFLILVLNPLQQHYQQFLVIHLQQNYLYLLHLAGQIYQSLLFYQLAHKRHLFTLRLQFE